MPPKDTQLLKNQLRALNMVVGETPILFLNPSPLNDSG